jgi:hypothetical protein
MMDMIVTRLMGHLNQLESTHRVYDSLDIWIIAIGMVASTGTANYPRFKERARGLSTSLRLENSDDALFHIKRVLWLEILQGENAIRSHWDSVIGKDPLEPPTYTIYASSSRALPS